VRKKQLRSGKEKTLMGILIDKKTRAFSILACTILLLQATAFVSLSQAVITVPSEPEVKLDVEADVGAMHFKGETADFYVLVSLSGVPTDATVNASLYFNGALYANLTSLVQHVDTGLYRIPYTIPGGASAGTYALVVDAYYLSIQGTTLKSFLLSQTLTGWNAWITEIHNNVAIIKTDIGTIQVSLENIDATITNIEENIVTIKTNIGIVETNVNNILLNITNIQGNTTEISTILGDLEGSILTINEGIMTINTTVGIFQTSISSLNATLTEIQGSMATITTNVGQIQVSLNQINAKLVTLSGDVATIKTDIGTIETSINSIQAKVTAIQGNTATISTTLGDLTGTITDIQGDIATIKTDIGEIKVTLGEMNTSAQEGIDTTSVGIVLAVIVVIAVVTVGALVLRKRKSVT
jgi:peptidoglycan hydrolase CwlO-like protein